jgi:hypothetical protein
MSIAFVDEFAGAGGAAARDELKVGLVGEPAGEIKGEPACW